MQKSNNQCLFDELTWQMHKKKERKNRGEKIYFNLYGIVQAKKNRKKRDAVTNDWLNMNKRNQKQFGFSYNYFY